ncbi:MAG TPA: AAA family ATPase [Candidatus Caenarcaniphilales bacterium]
MTDASLPALIEQMLQPGFYPHPVVEPIQLIQTHISYVLLTGDYAYKVKKPANFGFLDFSTLEQRQHFCHEELRLNRRLSPKLYLAVLPITTAQDSQYQLRPEPATSAKIVEYTVQMRAFDQDNLFSHLFERDQLSVIHMQQLGKLVADFHQAAQTSEAIQQFGAVEAVRQVAEDNYATSVPYIERAQTQLQLDQTRAFTEKFFADHRDWFRQRQEAGKIRECHGDLHLNNVCLYQDQIQIFDCIEFNEEFRNTDVIYDAAFMVMDLEFQGRSDLANVFLNAYLEQTGDYQGAVFLPLYLSMRAYIRAKVNSLVLDDPAISMVDKQQAQERAAAYYHTAWAYTQSDHRQLVLMCGLSGSGKTTVARHVAQAVEAVHIRSDAVRKHLAGIALDQRGDTAGGYNSGIYTPEMTCQTYERLLELGIFLAQQGLSVVLDAKYDSQVFRQAAIAQAEAQQIPLKIFYCTAPESVLRDRLQARQGDIADATADLVTAQQQAMEPFTEAEQAYVYTINTEQPLEPQLAQAVNQLSMRL